MDANFAAGAGSARNDAHRLPARHAVRPPGALRRQRAGRAIAVLALAGAALLAKAQELPAPPVDERLAEPPSLEQLVPAPAPALPAPLRRPAPAADPAPAAPTASHPAAALPGLPPQRPAGGNTPPSRP